MRAMLWSQGQCWTLATILPTRTGPVLGVLSASTFLGHWSVKKTSPIWPHWKGQRLPRPSRLNGRCWVDLASQVWGVELLGSKGPSGSGCSPGASRVLLPFY